MDKRYGKVRASGIFLGLALISFVAGFFTGLGIFIWTFIGAPLLAIVALILFIGEHRNESGVGTAQQPSKIIPIAVAIALIIVVILFWYFFLRGPQLQVG